MIIECYDLMRNRFPFSKSGGQKSGIQNLNSPWNPINNQQYGFNNPSNYNNQPTGWYDNTGSNNPNTGTMNFIKNGGLGNPNYQQGQMGFNDPNQYPNFNSNNRPPIPFQSPNINRNFIITSEIIANGQKFAGTTKQTFDKLKT